MKLKSLRLLLLLLSMSLSTNVNADGEDSISVIIIPDNSSIQRPHRAPAYQDVYAIYNWNDLTLSLIVSPEIEVTSVEVYRNGTQIIAETIPTLFYDLSSYGSGEYTIQVTTVIEITYIGHFIIN